MYLGIWHIVGSAWIGNTSENAAEFTYTISPGCQCVGSNQYFLTTTTSQNNPRSYQAKMLLIMGSLDLPVNTRKLQNGLEWLWVPFSHPSSQSPTDDVHLHHYLHELSKMLSEGASIYLHCDGSQHRCSLLFYALCHYVGIPSNSAYNALHSFGRNAANNLSRSELTWAAELGHTAPRS